MNFGIQANVLIINLLIFNTLMVVYNLPSYFFSEFNQILYNSLIPVK